MNKIFLSLALFNVSVFMIIILLFVNGIFDLNVIVPLAFSSVTATALMLYRRGLGFALVYLAYLTLSHLSIPMIELVDETPLYYKLGNDDWYFASFKDRAVTIAVLGIVSFNLAVSFTNSITQRKRHRSVSYDQQGDRMLHLIGRVFVAGFFGYLLVLSATGKLPLFSSYEAYFNALENVRYYSIGLFLYAIGMAFIFSNTSRKQLVMDLFIIGLPALLLISSGNRGEIFYPLVVGVGVLLYRGMKIKKGFILALLFTLFIFIPFVEQNRTIGLDNAGQMEFEFNVTDPFIELGYQLRPYFYTYSWFESGEDLGKGISYFVPVQRIATKFIPFAPRHEYEGKPYNFRERLPGMGYSVISEAYYNYSIAGVIVVMAAVGILLSVLGDLAKSYYHLSFAAGLSAILINNIRNAFSFVPGQVFILFILLAAIYLMKEFLEKNKNMEPGMLYGKNNPY